MEQKKILFGEWQPDQPSISGSVSDAINCFPVANGYAPGKSEADSSSAAAQDLLITFAGKFAGASSLFAAGATDIYKFDSSDASLDSVTSTTYSTVTSWDVTQFGSKIILANGQDKLQSYQMGTSSVFANLASAAPTAKFVTVVKDFVVAANVSSNENRVYWSDINDETDWTPASTSQSDNQSLPDGGDITGVAGGEFGLIFLERAIYRMTYSGSPFFFQFDAISRSQGCISNGSITQYAGLTYFLADDGFYVCDGNSTKNIGVEKVNRWFFNNVIPSTIETGMSATIDPFNKLAVWCFDNSFGGKYLLFYNIDLNKWSYAETDATSISFGLTPSATLEQIDNYNNNIDTLDTSLDSRVWAGGNLLFTGVRSNKIISFSSSPKAAYVSTSDIDVGQSVITLARPIVNNGIGSVATSARKLISDSVEFETAISPDAENRVSLRSNGRYHRLKINPTSDNWDTIVGVDINIVGQGIR